MKKIYTGLVCCCVLLSIQSLSQTWNGSANSDWNNAANWTPSNVPTSSGNVIINNSSAIHQPVLTANAGIRTLNMSAGILNLNGYTLACSVSATFTGDSLYNGKIVSATFNDLANMHMGGKIVLDRTGSANEWWQGKNKFYGDSLIIIWRSGGLSMENAGLSPDSIFGNLKLVYSDNNATTYRISIGVNSPIWIQNDLILDNPDKGVFGLDNASEKIIGGNIKAIDFSSAVPNFPLANVTVLGSNANGPFYAHTGSIDNCRFNGNFSFVADSSVSVNITNSSFLGSDNVFQAGSFGAYGNKFGKSDGGTTILRATNNQGYNIYMRSGSNKFIGNAQWEGYAVSPGGLTMQHNWFGPDTCLKDLNFVLKGNSALNTNSNGHNYVAGNVVIDGQGKRKWIQFDGGTGNTFTVDGSFTAKNFTAAYEPGISYIDLYLHNLYVNGTDTMGTFNCRTGNIQNSSFKGDLKLIADSNYVFSISSSSLLGANNLIQAGTIDFNGNMFGQTVAGTTTLRGVYNEAGSLLMRDGNNKFFGNVNIETYALYPGSITIQQTFYGQDSCLGNMNFILKGNSSLTTNGEGNNYVAGNLTIDGQGARKWVQFAGGAGRTFNVGGSFTAKNFTPFSVPGAGPTNVYLHNLFVTGTDTVGTFYCYTGDITGCTFNGDFNLIADSSQLYVMNYSSFLGANNLFQSGTLDFHNNKFGRSGNGTTTLRATNSVGANMYMRDGLNNFLGNAQWETYALYPGSITIQQTFYGQDSCLGNMNFILKGNSSLTTNGEGNNYVAGNLTIDGQGARKWVQFAGGAGRTFNVGGSFTAKNFTPFSVPGAGPTNVYLHNLFVTGTDTVGTFYCYTGDINASIFHGNLKLIADSSQGYVVNNSFLIGADNLLQAGIVETQNNKFGQTAAGTTILKSVLNSGSSQMRDGNNKFFGDAQWDVIAPVAGAILIQQTFFGVDTCLGNVTINLNGPSSANLGGNNLYIGKGLSLQNNGSGVIVHDNGGSAIYFIGADTANYSHGGSGSVPSLQNIGINRRGGLRLMSPLTCSGLILTRGIILSSSANPLKMQNVAVVVGGGDSSYVDGPVTKTGNTAFTFPLGKNNVYAALGITAPLLATDAFTAQYFNHLAHIDGYDSTQHDFSLNHLSRREYWTLNRTNGTSQVNVTLSWKEKRSGGVTSMADLRIAHWNGTTWKDEGNGGTTGGNTEGTILSLNAINSFSPFTLASIGTSNPLPVRFITFDVQWQQQRTVLVKWITSAEIDNHHFEVQRSNDRFTWITLQTIFPNANGVYFCIDKNAANGINYYRIKQVDFNGSSLYTQVKMINIDTDNVIFLWPNPVVNEMHLQLPFSKGIIDITDANGRILFTKIVESNNILVPVWQLKAGNYFARIKNEKDLYVREFVKM